MNICLLASAFLLLLLLVLSQGADADSQITTKSLLSQYGSEVDIQISLNTALRILIPWCTHSFLRKESRTHQYAELKMNGESMTLTSADGALNFTCIPQKFATVQSDSMISKHTDDYEALEVGDLFTAKIYNSKKNVPMSQDIIFTIINYDENGETKFYKFKVQKESCQIAPLNSLDCRKKTDTTSTCGTMELSTFANGSELRMSYTGAQENIEVKLVPYISCLLGRYRGFTGNSRLQFLSAFRISDIVYSSTTYGICIDIPGNSGVTFESKPDVVGKFSAAELYESYTKYLTESEQSFTSCTDLAKWLMGKSSALLQKRF